MKRLLMLMALMAVVLPLRAMTGIAGTVTDSATGLPIGHALVQTQGGWANTGQDGHYLMQLQHGGSYVVHAGAHGYEPKTYPDTVFVTDGQVTEHIDFALQQSGGGQPGGISGQVFDATRHQPIDSATVTASGPNGERQVLQLHDGYLIDSLAPGAYRVTATAPGHEPGNYPESVRVADGRIAEHIDFALHDSGGGSQFGGIAGRVLGRDHPIDSATVTASGPNGERQVLQLHDGYLIDSLAPGAYWVTATAPGYKPGNFPENVHVQAGPPVPNINIMLADSNQHPRAGISGVITDSVTHHPIPGATVVASNDSLRRVVMQLGRGYFIPDLPPGRYCVSAQARGYSPGTYPESVDVAEGQTVDSIDIALVRDSCGHGGSISGIVTNKATGEPIFGTMVDAEGPGHGRANTGPDGRYRMGWLPAGTYVVRAQARGFEPSAPDTIVVSESSAVVGVDFALVPMGGRGSGVIAGAVTDSATGNGIPCAWVFAWGPSGQGFGFSDSAGNYLVCGLRSGSYVVRAWAPGYIPGVYPDTVAVGDSDTVSGINIVLKPVPRHHGGLSGFVYNGSDQSELVGLTVTAVGPNGSYQTVAGPHGEYLFDNIEPGNYTITVSGSGYSDATSDVVVVEQGQIEAFTSPASYPIDGVEASPVTAITKPSLSVNPNPIHGSARLSWEVPVAGFVTVRLYDNTGRVVKTLQNGYQAAGAYSATWNGTGERGQRLADGVYFYRMDVAGLRGVQKVVLSAR